MLWYYFKDIGKIVHYLGTFAEQNHKHDNLFT